MKRMPVDPGFSGFALEAVQLIAEQRVAEMLHMHANLVCPPRLQPQPDKRRFGEPPLDPVVRDRGIARFRYDAEMRSVRIAVDRRIHGAGIVGHAPVDDGEILFLQLMRLHLLGNLLVDVRIFATASAPDVSWSSR